MIAVDVAVVGAGIAGAAAARSLAEAGRSVVTFEQFEPGHPRGSSHGASRIFRFSYDDPVFVRMAMDSLPMWREIEQKSGVKLLVTTGGLDSGPDVDAHARALDSCGARFEVMDAAEVSRRWPQVRVSPDYPALWHPDAGFLAAGAAVDALIGLAADAGADLHVKERVEGLEIRGDEVLITTGASEYRADVVVVAAGAWARSLLSQVDVDLPVTPTRETVAYFAIGDHLRLPTLVEWTDPPCYALPAPGYGIKAGQHHAGPVTNPDDVGEVSSETVEKLSQWITDRYPNADPVPVYAETCIYTNTSDESFIFERHGPIVVGSACSGHGFKFGPLTGQRLADLALSPDAF